MDRKEYMKEYYKNNKDKQKKSSYESYRKKKLFSIGINKDYDKLVKGLEIKKGVIIIDFN